jgi:hypothetical protein
MVVFFAVLVYNLYWLFIRMPKPEKSDMRLDNKLPVTVVTTAASLQQGLPLPFSKKSENSDGMPVKGVKKCRSDHDRE